VHYEHCRIAIVRLKHIIGMLVIGKVSWTGAWETEL